MTFLVSPQLDSESGWKLTVFACCLRLGIGDLSTMPAAMAVCQVSRTVDSGPCWRDPWLAAFCPFLVRE